MTRSAVLANLTEASWRFEDRVVILDARSLPEGEALSCDVCIVGGGAAGITMALEFRDAGVDVILLVGGERWFDEAAQSLYEGPNTGIQGWALDEARLRMLGGSTNHWAGNCMPLDPIDFETRDGVAYSGWPISRADLDPYYLRAQPYVETPGAEAYDTKTRIAEIGPKSLPLDPAKLRTFLFAESPPTAFGDAYEEDLERMSALRVFLNGSALEIDTNHEASEVTRVQAASIDGGRFTVQASYYVLAAGGVEITRILLLSNSVNPAGLANENDLVGRFFSDHYSIRPSLTALAGRDAEDFRLYMESHPIDGGYFRGAIGASEALLRKEKLPNFLFYVQKQDNASPGQQSAQTLRRSLARGEAPPKLLWHLENILTDMDGVTNEVYRTLTRRSEDLIPRVWVDPWIVTETIPERESRIKLVESRDPIFGQNQVEMDWRMASGQLEAFIRATEVLAEELGRLGYGRVWSGLLQEPPEWPTHPAHGKHHCGTTRMSDEPKTGVVDRNCRVHGVSNLFVASSSVFPTNGAGTPTLTILALTIRLADHLKDRLKARDL